MCDDQINYPLASTIVAMLVTVIIIFISTKCSNDIISRKKITQKAHNQSLNIDLKLNGLLAVVRDGRCEEKPKATSANVAKIVFRRHIMIASKSD